ncbi:type III-A CRISPR-associated protein Csm2 [Candidatus Symbiobacter mobilis]|uniref:CRISPR system Cms protein Csm2 n=1 Tax=Candidatus Symbiobacter mobilis CR TaxID=946483 RepID=U5N6C6_9BURK|nr:type III-A CRISPR-associated protein Csm2 [Candidatus Symbiobacter mobilis]AGX86912.1 hypothetical protein Cenrod_0806 [Candidatus Symbiobacter mobilis CR]
MWHDKVHAPEGFTENPGSKAQRQARYEQAVPFIRMMVAKVAYARARKHVEGNFEKLLTHVIRSIQDPDTLQNAKLFMEAFMGFYRVHSK